MKKTILFTLILFVSLVGYSQVTEVFTFTKDNKPDDENNYYENYIFQGKYYYSGKSAGKTYLYVTDGINQPVQLKEITSTSKSSGATTYPTSGFDFISNEKYLYFSTTTIISTGGVVEYELWRTDGTSDGTLRLLSYSSTTVGFPSITNSIKLSNEKIQNSINGGILFFASVTPKTRSLWKSDGTVEGTQIVKEFPANGISEYYNYVLEKVGTNYVFIRYNPATYFYDLWKTDGTTAGTVQMKDGFGNAQAVVQTIGKLGDKYYYSSSLSELYSTDGVTAVKEQDLPLSNFIHGQPLFNKSQEFYYILKSSGTSKVITVYFVQGDMSNKKKLVEFDATSEDYKVLYANNEGVFLNKLDSSSNLIAQVFVNKTTGNVITFSNLIDYQRNNVPLKMLEYQDQLYFGAPLKNDTNLVGNELWKLGLNSPELVADVYPGSTTFFGMTIVNGSSPNRLFMLGGKLYFVGNSSSGTKLYSLGNGSLGTDELLIKNNQVIVYPNPSSGVFKINFDEELTNSQVIIYNSNGAIVSQFQLKDQAFDHHLNSGLYIIKVNTANETFVQKLIIE